MPVRSRRESGKGSPKYLGLPGGKSGISLRGDSQNAAPDSARPDGLPLIWRGRAELLSRYAPEAAKVFEECATDLERALQSTASELLTLRDAADFSGYSADHLGRLLRTGRLTNYGRSHSPRLRRSELPRKSPVADLGRGPRLLGATPRQVAQAVASSYKGDR